MKPIKPCLVLNMPAQTTLQNSFGFSGTTVIQIIKLLFQLVTVNASELLPTCVFSKLNVSEPKNLNCISRDLVHQDHASLVSFIIYLCRIIISKNARMLLANFSNYENS